MKHLKCNAPDITPTEKIFHHNESLSFLQESGQSTNLNSLYNTLRQYWWQMTLTEYTIPFMVITEVDPQHHAREGGEVECV